MVRRFEQRNLGFLGQEPAHLMQPSPVILPPGLAVPLLFTPDQRLARSLLQALCTVLSFSSHGLTTVG